MSASDQHRLPVAAKRRHPVVRRLAQSLTVGLLFTGALWFAPVWLGQPGAVAFAVCLGTVTVLALFTFVGSLLTRDVSVAVPCGFALTLLALYWLIMITHGMLDFV